MKILEDARIRSLCTTALQNVIEINFWKIVVACLQTSDLQIRFHDEYILCFFVLQFIQDPVCVSLLQLQCTEESEVDISKCLHPCSGLVVASFQKEDVIKDLESLFPLVIDAYNKYKIITHVPFGYQSNKN